MEDVTIRVKLPGDKVKHLRELAEQKNCGLSHLIGSIITDLIDHGALGGSEQIQILSELREVHDLQKELKAILLGKTSHLSSLAGGILDVATDCQYSSHRALENTDDLLNYSLKSKTLNSNERRLLKQSRISEVEELQKRTLLKSLGLKDIRKPGKRRN
jgi:hypothetical protein